MAELFLDREGAMETGTGMIKKPHPRIPFLYSYLVPQVSGLR